MTDTDCTICTNRFTTCLRQQIECPRCLFVCCTACVKQFLLSNTIYPKCMSCNSQWDMEFVRIHLSKHFLNSSYKQHQIQVFLSEAETSITSLQPFVHLERESKALDSLFVDAIHHRTALQQQVVAFRVRLLKALPEERRTIRKQIKESRRQLFEQNNHTSDLFHLKRQIKRALLTGILPNQSTQKEDDKEKNNFYFACPRFDCRGQISHVYKCGLCHHWICPDCHADKGTDREIPHECSETDKETVKILKENTKPCPSCHEGIFKVSGCDQMWCTQCHTCFSWRTGQILSGRVHNPHYYEYQRLQNNQERVLGDIPCGGLPQFFMVRTKIIECKDAKKTHTEKIENIHRLLNHIIEVVLHQLGNEAEQRTNYLKRNYGIQFLQHQLTREEWGQKLYTIYRKHERKVRLRQLFEMMTTTGGDLFRNWLNDATSFQELFHTFVTLFTYVNEQIELLNHQYNTKIPLLYCESQTYDLYRNY